MPHQWYGCLRHTQPDCTVGAPEQYTRMRQVNPHLPTRHLTSFYGRCIVLTIPRQRSQSLATRQRDPYHQGSDTLTGTDDLIFTHACNPHQGLPCSFHSRFKFIGNGGTNDHTRATLRMLDILPISELDWEDATLLFLFTADGEESWDGCRNGIWSP
ncbi:hypothetical protein BO70DRAFT_397520 [Aspergillus heteromorphus CBS 117.55]|uniref:Uncharacterized protein n=1 Tax=Aspergillus heteromorphus CBS 117.55 TaxID=1448321 RepID=A0A317VZB3_9EURO|nr:uncharacterized protein BO70DRAFT_397520 [Aspergillus heteromorphus CBS 117.55]PWY78278.1 hypothetical protein BO70DRAFT_397520 [Aspergillus heteromorphus CBS 117.55]